ncbi:MAG: hypothetical protein AB1730_22895 [Myxococcota bacterium]
MTTRRVALGPMLAASTACGDFGSLPSGAREGYALVGPRTDDAPSCC